MRFQFETSCSEARRIISAISGALEFIKVLCYERDPSVGFLWDSADAFQIRHVAFEPSECMDGCWRSSDESCVEESCKNLWKSFQSRVIVYIRQVRNARPVPAWFDSRTSGREAANSSIRPLQAVVNWLAFLLRSIRSIPTHPPLIAAFLSTNQKKK